MKKIFTLAAICFATMSLQAQVRMPQPSTAQTITQEFGQGTIEVKYSRPNAKDRKIYGDLVPYGKLWRTGANAATKLTFNEPVIIGDTKIEAGSYALYTIPGEKEWTIIINKGHSNSGTVGYKESDDVVRVTAKPEILPSHVETFTIGFSQVGNFRVYLDIIWSNTKVSLPIMTDFKDKLRGEIEEALKGDKKPHWQAAQFYFEYDNDPVKALEQVDHVLNQNAQAFWVHHYKAKILMAMKNYKAAKESAETSFQLAKDANNDDYMKLNKQIIDEVNKMK